MLFSLPVENKTSLQYIKYIYVLHFKPERGKIQQNQSHSQTHYNLQNEYEDTELNFLVKTNTKKFMTFHHIRNVAARTTERYLIAGMATRNLITRRRKQHQENP